jgi:TldD protein
VLLDPSVTASLLDAGARALLTSAAARRPEVKRRIVTGASVAAPAITLIDDPTVRGAYGGFEYDDEGEPATRITLIDHGTLAGALADHAGGGRGRGRRPGHVGPLEPSPSHLRLLPGGAPHSAWRDDGFILEDGAGAIVDPGTTRVVIAASRAREIRAGNPTGRVFADVELVGDLGMLLGAVADVSSNTTSFAVRDEREGEPRWRSIEAPWMRIPLDVKPHPGVVRGRRRLA